MNQQKGHILLIVVLIVAVISGYLIYTKNSNNLPAGRQGRTKPTVSVQPSQILPTPAGSSESTDSGKIVNWKTYTNSKYGYSIQYPSAYKISNSVSEVKDLPDNSPFMYITKDYLGADTCPKFATFIIIKKQQAPDIRAADYSDSIDIKAFMFTKIGETIKDAHYFNRPNKRLDNEVLGNKPAFVFESQGDDNNHTIKRSVVETDKFFYIIETCLTKESMEDLNLYKQILSTFKFQ